MYKDIREYILQIYECRNLLYQLVRLQIILRYRRTLLGYLWTLVTPLLMMSVTSIVFSAIFKMDLKTYAIFLFSGVIAFNLFSTTVVQSGQSLIGNEQLIKKIFIPKILFPLANSLAVLIDSFLMFLSLMIIIYVIGGPMTTKIFFVLPAYLLLFTFSFGIALIFCVVAVYFRDMQHLIGVLMQALIFLSPVYYKTDSFAGKVEWIISINPLTQFITLFRSPIYQGVLPDTFSICLSVVYAGLSLTLGLWYFGKHQKFVAFRM